MDDEVRQEIRRVLDKAQVGKGTERGFLTAYQILLRLPEEMRQALIKTYSVPGKGAGAHYSAASLVATKLDAMQAEVEKAYFDPAGVKFDVGDEEFREAGYTFVAIYRQKPSA